MWPPTLLLTLPGHGPLYAYVGADDGHHGEGLELLEPGPL